MRNRIEDLLTLRDGEPIDAHLKACLANDAQAVAELERLRALKAELESLSELEPPAGLEARVIEAMGRSSGWRQARRTHRWAASFVVAAAVLAALAAVAFRLGGPPSDTPAPSTDAAAAGGAATNVGAVSLDTSAPDTSASAADAQFRALLSESARLERILAGLPAQRRIMNGGTAGTIAGLETQIAFIDDQLTVAAVAGLEPEFRHALWQERVDVMNALVQVRYAQSQAFWF